MKELVNKNVEKGKFRIDVPVSIISKTLKNSEGKEYTQKYFYGEASNNKVDKGDERVSKAWIKKMYEQLKGLNVFVEHEHHVEKTLGNISEIEAGGDESIKIYTALDDENENSLVKSIIRKSQRGMKFYYSIFGRVTKATKQFSEELGKNVKELIDGEVYEVSITALPEGNVDAATVISKSMNDAFPDTKEDEVSKKVVKKLKDVSGNELVKALKEMVQTDEINQKMSNLYWAFRDAIYKITNDESLTPAQKKEKIMNLSSEYATEIEALSTTLANLTQKVEEDLS